MIKDYLAEISDNSRESNQNEAEFLFSLCCAMVCGKMSN